MLSTLRSDPAFGAQPRLKVLLSAFDTVVDATFKRSILAQSQGAGASRNERRAKLSYPPNGAWPEEMPASMAAAFVGEVSVAAFLAKVGSVWPLPHKARGSRQKWSRERLLEAVRNRHGLSDGVATEEEIARLI